MEKFFHLKENGTTVSTEILAGLTTFFAMAYIIVVNPQILPDVYLEVQHPCWSCNSNSSSANASAGVR